MAKYKVFYPLQIVFKHTEHKTTTQSDHDYDTCKLCPVPNPSRGPLLGLMTIQIVYIKESGDVQSTDCLSARSLQQKEPAPPSP